MSDPRHGPLSPEELAKIERCLDGCYPSSDAVRLLATVRQLEARVKELEEDVDDGLVERAAMVAAKLQEDEELCAILCTRDGESTAEAARRTADRYRKMKDQYESVVERREEYFARAEAAEARVKELESDIAYEREVHDLRGRLR